MLTTETRDTLTDLAARLGYFVVQRGTYEGLPSIPDLLESLAAAYRADPAAVADALTAAGVVKRADADD